MGLQFQIQSQEGNKKYKPSATMNRLIALFAVVACAFAEPEADPQVFYNTYGYYPYAHHGLAHASPGLVRYPASGAVVPADTASVAVAKANHLATKAATYATRYPYVLPYVLRGKREAEAEPEAEADPQVFYNSYYPYAHTYGSYAHVAAPVTYTHTAPVVTQAAVSAVKPAVVTKTAPVVQYTYPTYTYPTYAHLAHHVIAKRDAEADSDSQYFYNGAYGYGGFYRPYTYGAYSAYSGYPYTYGACRWY